MNYLFFLIICSCAVIYPVRKLRKVSIIIILLTFLAVIVIYPTDTISSAREGINLWLNIVIPSLLPFFIINDMLIALKVPENISNFLKPAAKFLFNTSGYGAYAFIMSIFAGYPSGAKIVSQLIKDKKITPSDGQKILTFSSTSGPLFIIGAIGTGMLGSAKLGYILFLSHILGSVINGIFARIFFKKENAIFQNYKSNSNNSPKGDMLSESIITSLYTIGIIGGYIIIFSTIIKLLDSISFFKILTYLFVNIVNISSSASQIICILIKSLFEISNGCKILSISAISTPAKLIFISFIVSFSGLSIIGQVSSIIKNTGLKIKTYLLFKITQGIFSSLVCFILINNKSSISVFYPETFNSYDLIHNISYYTAIYLIIIVFLNIIGYFYKNDRIMK